MNADQMAKVAVYTRVNFPDADNSSSCVRCRAASPPTG